MLRNFVSTSYRVYTCTCLTPSSRSLLYKGDLANQLWSRFLQTSSTALALDKDLKGKKSLIKMGQHLKFEETVLTQEETNMEAEGLFEAGVTIPTLETHASMVRGVRFDQLPIVHIKSSLNNTIINVTDFKGGKIAFSSCGMEGFKNVKKSTNVAAQATGLSVGKKAKKKGVHSVRAVVKGLGAGRLASLKGMEMAGINVVSITDNTPVPHNGCRPRKQKRL